MTLPQPIAVAAAISGGTPADVREWIRVDIEGSPSVYRPGYAVLVEPLSQDGRTQDLVSQVRDVLVHQLRLNAQFPPDVALVRAFAHANSVLQDDKRHRPGDRVQIGATAVVMQDHQATIAHLPPGQLILVQDHLIYGLPELDSYLPHWAGPKETTAPAEPLGYGVTPAPVLVQTELMPGDAIILCDSATARVIATADQETALPVNQFRGRNPDLVLDAIRDQVSTAGEPYSAAVVISFPPNEVASEIETFADVARNAREQMRHVRAATRTVIPAMPERLQRAKRPEPQPAQADENAFVPPPKPKISLQERLIRLSEGRPAGEGATWQPRRLEAAFGAPGAHGVRRHRRISSQGPAVRSAVPRAPFITSPMFIGIALSAVFLLGMLIWNQRELFLPDESTWSPMIAQVDQRLSVVNGMTDQAAIFTELDNAQKDLDAAAALGAPDSEVDQRQLAITLERDEVSNVIRVGGVRKLGNLPDELRDGETSAYMTAGGMFLVNGDLYRLNPETAEIAMMLEEGREIEGMRVGNLYGVAYDGLMLAVTDGRAVFFASNTDGAIWQAMEMEEINNQGPYPPGPIAAFNQSVYLLVSDWRNIYVFPTDANEQVVAPIDWVSVGDRINMNIAVDITIDGNIYVLLEDGQVVTLRSGLEINRFDLPNFDPEKERAVALVSGPATGYIYMAVVDKDGNGRVIATDREGGHVVELHLPIDWSNAGSGHQAPFAGLQDVVVDEQAGRLYLINGDAVWSLDYSLPPLPSATPEAVATP